MQHVSYHTLCALIRTTFSLKQIFILFSQIIVDYSITSHQREREKKIYMQGCLLELYL